MLTIAQFTHTLGIALALLATAYALLACLAEVMTAKRPRGSRASAYARTASASGFGTTEHWPPVTILKPLCGSEPNLYECLRSFCTQDYPCFQIVFGVHDSADAALASVRRLQLEMPTQDIVVVIEPRLHGSNHKVSNLANMLSAARHPILVLSDSDVSVDAGYLRRVTAPLEDPTVGLVTSLYRARADDIAWSRLLAQFINEWFMPAVRIAQLFGSASFTSGVTIALRRQTLAHLGGFDAIANVLADDYWLGERTRRLGLRTVVAEGIVDTLVAEPSFRALCRHEVRWLRTIRSVQPRSYIPLSISFTLPVAGLGASLAGANAAALGLLAVAIAARLLLHHLAAPRFMPWLVPGGDLLAFALWCWSFASRRVRWRAALFAVARDGSMQRSA